MQAGRRYSFWQTVNWTRRSIFIFLALDSAVVILYYFTRADLLIIPWQPISLVGIAVAFYLGFKNNSSYERLWEARKIWGGIVNASRSFTIMLRDFITNEFTDVKLSKEGLREIHVELVHRHVAWLFALTYQLRNVKAWEHVTNVDNQMRDMLGSSGGEERFENLKGYMSEEDWAYMMSKGNRASHLLSMQSMQIRRLRSEDLIDDFRHMEMQGMLTEFYTLQGKAERIKNFPFPRQYATANYFFVVIFLLLLPFSMLSIFANLGSDLMLFMAIPSAVLVSWVFWMMEAIGEYSENPFEGLYNDVPITQIARGIEIDIRQMLEETDLPDPVLPQGDMKILV